MAPCEVEFRPKGKENWLTLNSVNSGDPPGSISDISGGRREIYIFECAPDNSKSTIYKSRFGVDWEIDGTRRAVIPFEDMEVIVELKKGESYELEVTTERGHSGTIRFTHK